MVTLTDLAGAAAEPVAFGGSHAGHGPPFPFFLIPLFWFLLLGGIAVALILGRRRQDRLAGERAGEQALAEMFASGAIDENEYRSRLSVLRERR